MTRNFSARDAVLEIVPDAECSYATIPEQWQVWTVERVIASGRSAAAAWGEALALVTEGEGNDSCAGRADE